VKDILPRPEHLTPVDEHFSLSTDRHGIDRGSENEKIAGTDLFAELGEVVFMDAYAGLFAFPAAFAGIDVEIVQDDLFNRHVGKRFKYRVKGRF
jgi:hypothetical protein